MAFCLSNGISKKDTGTRQEFAGENFVNEGGPYHDTLKDAVPSGIPEKKVYEKGFKAHPDSCIRKLF